MKPAYIHPTADVKSSDIGDNSRIWQFCVVLPGARIGEEANICSHCFIENNVKVGDRVTVKSGVQLWDGLTIGNDVFIGPNVSFTNDMYPKSKQYQDHVLKTEIDDWVSIGAGAVILPGIKLGMHSMIGAGAVVTRSVPPYAIVVGNPAKIVGYVDAKLDTSQQGHANNRKDIGASSLCKVTGVSLIKLPNIIDIRGNLSVGEFEREVPFSVKRYFIVFGVPSVETRGEHAHRECHQFLVCVNGNVSVVADDGSNREEFLLDRPNIGLYLPPMTWGIQYKYSSDAVLLVFASHYYNSDDYIRDYALFLKESRKCL